MTKSLTLEALSDFDVDYSLMVGLSEADFFLFLVELESFDFTSFLLPFPLSPFDLLDFVIKLTIKTLSFQ